MQPTRCYESLPVRKNKVPFLYAVMRGAERAASREPWQPTAASPHLTAAVRIPIWMPTIATLPVSDLSFCYLFT